MKKNAIFLKRKGKILPLPVGKSEGFSRHTATVLKNLETYGYTLSIDIIEKLNSMTASDVHAVYTQLIDMIKPMLGAHKKYEPMYPNFPRQVMEASDAELYINAMMHYLGDMLGVRILPSYVKEPREKLNFDVKLTVISEGTDKEFEQIFTDICASKTSIAEEDKELIQLFITSKGEDVYGLLPTEIPLKENIAVIGANLKQQLGTCEEFLLTYANTPTDVLRYMAAISGGDVSLTQNTKFVNIPRRERRTLLNILNESPNLEEDMLAYKNRWKRVGEILHPSEYTNIFPKCADAFKAVRNGGKFKTFNGKVEDAISRKDVLGAVDLLVSRPGVFARKLNELLKFRNGKWQYITTKFDEVAHKVSTPVLLQVMAYFNSRSDLVSDNNIGIYFPKGLVGKLYAREREIHSIDSAICEAIVESCRKGLRANYKERDELGSVWIDPALKNYHVPFAMRSASKALKTVARGSKIPCADNCDFIRLFIWWKDISSRNRVDIDLSAIGLNEDHKPVMQVSFTNLRGSGVVHSGDITSAPNGACEFIDVDINTVKSAGVRYIMMSVNSFTGQPFIDMPECFAGFMERQDLQSGEVFEPKTVVNKFDLTADTKMCIPVIFDLVEKKMVWADIALKVAPNRSNAVVNNMSSIALMNKSIVEMVKPNLYDMFVLNAEARGEVVTNVDDADFVIGESFGDITASDMEDIMANYI